jgi:GNAT superfamily N-acetyltransferase
MKDECDVSAWQSLCNVRAAQLRDCERMAELAQQLGYECTAKDVIDRLCDMQDAGQYAVLVAEVNGGQIAGWLGAYLFRSVETGTLAEISGLIVDKAIRSRGIGKALLNAFESWAQSVGCNVVSVRSNIRRGRAHRFYAGNGYAHIKTQKEFHKNV